MCNETITTHSHPAPGSHRATWFLPEFKFFLSVESRSICPLWPHYFTLPLAVCKGSIFSTSFPTLIIFFHSPPCLPSFPSSNSHPNICEIASHCSFHLHFPDEAILRLLPRASRVLKRAFQGYVPVLIPWAFSVGNAAAAKSLQSCPTLWDPIDGSPPGSPITGILQARTLEWVAISISKAWKWKVKVKSLSHVWLFVTLWIAAY